MCAWNGKAAAGAGAVGSAASGTAYALPETPLVLNGDARASRRFWSRWGSVSVLSL
jgi:hypothetical protein